MPRMLVSPIIARKKGLPMHGCQSRSRAFPFFLPASPDRRRVDSGGKTGTLAGEREDTLHPATPRCRLRESSTLANLKRAHYTPTQARRASPAFASPASALPLAARPAAPPPLGFPRKRLAPPPRLRRRPSPGAPLRCPPSSALPLRAPLPRFTLRAPPSVSNPGQPYWSESALCYSSQTL